MGHYGWRDCPVATREQVAAMLHRLETVLRGELVGVYLHGSLALGCFNPERSDIDLLIVTSHPITLAARRRLVGYLLASSLHPHPIECSSLTRDQLRPWRFPTPYDLHYSEGWRSRYAADLSAGDGGGTDYDLAAHFTVTSSRGTCLEGPAIGEVFPAVPRADYLESIRRDLVEGLEAIATNPVYGILGCCRTLAYLRDGLVLSKAEGGEWAAARLPDRQRNTIRLALDVYGSAPTSRAFDPWELRELATCLRAELEPLWR